MLGWCTLSRSDRAEHLAVATVALTTMLAPLNSTMIAVALPQVAAELAVDAFSASWLVTGYLIGMASLQPVAGKLGDRLGRRGPILAGVALFGAASLGAAAAERFPVLLLCRVLQAIAAALAFPNATALLRERIPAERRGGRFGTVGAAIALAAAAGPPVGGLLAASVGWRAIFAVNLLLVVPALVLGARAIPAAPKGDGQRRPFDVIGALLLSGGLVTGAYVLARGVGEWRVAASVALAVMALLFVVRELRHPDPILQLRHLARPALATANLAVALSNLALYSTLLAIPLLLSDGAGWGSGDVGMLLAVLSLGMVVCAPLGGRLADRLGRRGPALVGLALMTVGLARLAHVDTPTLAALLPGLGLTGAGVGLSGASLQTAAVETVAASESGMASGMFATSRYLGSIVGSSLLPGLVAGSAFQGVFLMAAAAALLSVVASAGLPGSAPVRPR